MRLRIATILAVLLSFSPLSLRGQDPIAGQDKGRIAVFVYPKGGIVTPLDALGAELTHAIIGSAKNVDVVDRSDEILEYLRKEHHYQESGMVRDDQLVAIGEHFGADLLCVVCVTDYPEYGQYFFEGKVVDMESRQIVNHSRYPTGDDSVQRLDPQTQVRVGEDLAVQLGFVEKKAKQYRDVYMYYVEKVRCK